jgi:hypothetical protein
MWDKLISANVRWYFYIKSGAAISHGEFGETFCGEHDLQKNWVPFGSRENMFNYSNISKLILTVD